MYKATSQRVKKGLLQMVIGRPLSAVCGLLVLVFLSRYLSKNDYGIYFTVWAVTELVILASNMGLMNVAYRYISAKELLSGGLWVEGPVWKCVILRFISLLGMAALTIYFSGYIPSAIIDSRTICKFSTYILIVIVFEGMARYFEIIFDSMLCQGMSQFTLIGRTCLRLMLLLWVVYVSLHVDIELVLAIECLVTISGALCGLIFLSYISMRSRMLARKNKLISESQSSDLLRVLKFIIPGYLGQMIALVYSPDMLKLILGGAAGTEALAIFGFAFSLAAVVQRYMPANLLGGIFRPAFVAAYDRNDDGKTLGIVLSLSMKANFIFILPCMAFCVFSADPLMARISGGNYIDIGSVLVVLLCWALALSLHLTLAMYCVALEYNYPTFIASLVSAISLPLGIVTAKYGAISIAGVIFLSEALWFGSCYVMLYRIRPIHIEYVSFARLLSTLIIAIVCSYFIYLIHMPWVIVSAFSLMLCMFCLYKINVFSQAESEWLKNKFPKLTGWF